MLLDHLSGENIKQNQVMDRFASKLDLIPFLKELKRQWVSLHIDTANNKIFCNKLSPIQSKLK